MPAPLRPPVPAVPQTTPKPPAAPTAFTAAPHCSVIDQPDGTMIVSFTVSEGAKKIWDRQRVGRNMVDFLWETRGLRHFEHQEIG